MRFSWFPSVVFFATFPKENFWKLSGTGLYRPMSFLLSNEEFKSSEETKKETKNANPN